MGASLTAKEFHAMHKPLQRKNKMNKRYCMYFRQIIKMRFLLGNTLHRSMPIYTIYYIYFA